MREFPRVSLFVFCYQQAAFIEQAMTAALAQDYCNLQVIISDDTSTDETYQIVQSIAEQYQGPHQLTLNRNAQNLGIGRHFIHIMDNLAEGELIVASAGDDISASNRVSRVVEEWLKKGKPALVAHALEEIDEQGQLFSGSRTTQYRLQAQPDKWPETMALHEYMQNTFPLSFIGAALAYRRDVYLQFGTPSAEPAYEDHLMYFRALLSGGLHYFPQVLVKYRRHANNFTAKSIKSQPKVLDVPLLYKSLLQGPMAFEADKVKDFRLHQLTTQQWLDYRKAVLTGQITADMTVVSTLWQRLIWGHRRLLRQRGGIEAWIYVLRYAVSQVLLAIRCRLGNTNYVYQDHLLAVDYASPLRTVVFGAGSGGERSLTNLCGGFHAVAVCDNNTKLHGSQFCGLPVISTEQLKDDINNIDCILVASSFFYEIKAKLTEELAIPEEKIGRASYMSISQPFSAGVTASITSALVITLLLLLLTLAALVLF